MPSIGKDLVKIRKHLGLTLQDIQFATKLPQHTLEKIEDDSIFVDAEEGPIYTRNFVRSYGRVLKIEDDVLIEALDQREAGKYNHLLLNQFPELSEKQTDNKNSDSAEENPAIVPPVPPENEPDAELKDIRTEADEQTEEAQEAKETVRQDTGEISSESDTEAELKEPNRSTTSDSDSNESSKTAKKAAPAAGSGSKKKISSKKGGTKEKSTKDVDWADLGQKINQEKKQMPVWVIGLIILIIILGTAGYFIMQSGLLNSDSALQEEITTPPEESGSSSLSIELDEPESQAQSELTDGSSATPQPAVSLNDTLTITVYAAFGNVDPIRVWSDTKPRFDPYWIEEGNAMIFDFEDSIQVRGPYDNMLIFFNGHLIENAVQNFYNEGEDYVELSRTDFTSDSKWSENTNLQVPEGVDPPEEIQSRPTF